MYSIQVKIYGNFMILQNMYGRLYVECVLACHNYAI